MRALWRVLAGRRDFRLVLSAGLVSLTGDWILQVGLAYYVYRLTGSTLATGVMVLAGTLPQLLLGTVAGTFVDRWSRRGTMIAANLLMAAGLLPLLLVSDAGRVWIVYLVMFFEASVAQFFQPAEAALVPHLVPDQDLVAANALNGQTRDVARLVGAAAGGAAVGLGGLAGVALLDAASFLLAAGLLTLVRVHGAVGTAGGSALRDWIDGLGTAVRNPTVRVTLLFVAVTSVGEGAMATLMAPFVSTVLHGTGQAYGTILAVQAAGGLLGGLVAAALGYRVPAKLMFGAGAVLFGVLDLVLFLYPLVVVAVWPAGVIIALVGLPGACVVAGLTTVLQRETSDDARGRVFGALGAVSGLGALLSTLGAGVLGDRIGIVPVIATQGAGFVVAGIMVLALLPNHAPDRSPRPAPTPVP